MTQASFSFTVLEHSLGRYFDVPPAKIARFRSRIKQLQRLEFPSGVNVGRGAKMPYKTEHLFKLILAFELVDSGITAKPAATIVERHWPKFRAGIGAAITASKNSSVVFGNIVVNALEDLAGEASRVSIDDESSRLNLEQNTTWGTVCYTTVNLTGLIDRLMERLKPTKNLPIFFLDLELKQWGADLPEFDPFGETDWFRLGAFDSSGIIKYHDSNS